MSQSRPNIAASGGKDAANIISFLFAENKPLFKLILQRHLRRHFACPSLFPLIIIQEYSEERCRLFHWERKPEMDRYGEAADEGSIILSYYLLYTRQSILMAQFVWNRSKQIDAKIESSRSFDRIDWDWCCMGELLSLERSCLVHAYTTIFHNNVLFSDVLIDLLKQQEKRALSKFVKFAQGLLA